MASGSQSSVASAARLGPFFKKDSKTRTQMLSDSEKAAALREAEDRWQNMWYTLGTFEGGGVEVRVKKIGDYGVKIVQRRMKRRQRFYGSVPLLPMDGRPNMSQAVPILQVDFAAGFALMNGKRAIFPIAFQCSGTSIQDRAERVEQELRAWEAVMKGSWDLASPTTRYTCPESLLLYRQGIPATFVKQFASPGWWMTAFPELVMKDLKGLGIRVDWRRTFVTGDQNPYYSSFVQWQMKRLRDLRKLRYGKAYTLFSPMRREPCPERKDRDGNRVGVERTLAVKMEVVEVFGRLKKILENVVGLHAKIYVVCTLSKPEYAYSIGCCWVNPKAPYGLHCVSQNEFFLMFRTAANNMACQGFFPTWGSSQRVLTIRGYDLVGIRVKPPLVAAGSLSTVRLLADHTFDPSRGTGIRASFPTEDLFDHLEWLRYKESLKGHGPPSPEWVLPVPTMETPDGKPHSAMELLTSQESISKPAETKTLKDANDWATSSMYLNGHMRVEGYRDTRVRDARGQIWASLLASGHGFEYLQASYRSRPMPRDDYLVVAYIEHWYLDYGEQDGDGGSQWLRRALDLLNSENFRNMPVETKWELQATLLRLSSWAVARDERHRYGTPLPWDDDLMVEPFIEAAIAPAYQTFAHQLHSDMSGGCGGTSDIHPEQMTDRVWDILFSQVDVKPDELHRINTTIDYEDLVRLRSDFRWLYPMNLFVADKSQAQDQLAFFFLHHVGLWIPKLHPRGVMVSGELLLQGRRMNNAKGHSVTISDMTSKYGADAVRMAVARTFDAEVSGNVEWDEDLALQSMRRLFDLKDFIERAMHETLGGGVGGGGQSHDGNETRLPQRDGEIDVWELILMDDLEHIMRKAGLCYARYQFRKAVQYAFDETASAFGSYSRETAEANLGLHKSLLMGFIRMQVLLLAPICPHWCETIWQSVLKESTTVHEASFPEPVTKFSGYAASTKLLRDTVARIRQEVERLETGRRQERRVTEFDPDRRFAMIIMVGLDYVAWQLDCLERVKRSLSGEDNQIDLATVKQGLSAAETPRYAAFTRHLQELLNRGMDPDSVLSPQYPCEQVRVLGAVGKMLANTLQNCARAEVTTAGNVPSSQDGDAGQPTPGFPTWQFYNLP